MDTGRPRQIEQFYHAALELDGDARAALLAQANPDVRREVESLLAQLSSDSFLARPVVEAAAHLLPTQGANEESGAAALPSRIGQYRIEERIGAGGMGVVYRAEQEHPRRIVALKVIKSGWANLELLRRFERESQALGRLQHPGIAQIYEAGTEDAGFGPQPYFAMEFIEGRSLREYVQTHHLTTRARLDLMVKICDAVHHAHQRGIIHRDLKPGNILVDGTGQPKILDFGVARMTDADAQATRQTDLGQLVGTLAYMSPEQVLADPLELDTRSDVYALGVILYELLAGRLPYTLSRKLHEAVQTIREADPAPLSSVNQTYRGDIETIVAKALEKDKTRRYNSAADLAADIRRYLQDEPIAARPASAAYQLQKFARRNRALVAGIAAVFIVLAAGVVASTWEAIRANRAGQAAIAERDHAVDAEAKARAAEQATAQQRDRAVSAEQTANTERNHAVSAQNQAVEERNRAVAEQRRADSESAIAKAVSDFLQNDLLAQASANNQATPNTKPDPDLKVRTALDRAAARIPGKFEKQPLVEAAVRQTIGDTYRDLSLYNQAQQHMERALELRRKFQGEENPDTLAAMNDLALIYKLQGKNTQAEPLYTKVLEVRRRVLGEENPATLSTLNSLASLYEKEGHYPQAETLNRQAYEILKGVAGEDSKDTISAMGNLALVYVREGKFADAEALDRKAVDMMPRVFGAEHPDMLTMMNNLAQVYSYEGKYSQAEELQSKIYDTLLRILGPEHNNTLLSMNNLAVIYFEEGKYPQADAILTKNFEIVQRVFGPDHPSTLVSMNNLAGIYSREEKYPEAERLYARLLGVRRRVLGATHPETTTTMATLIGVQLKQAKFADAEALAREALAILEQDRPNDWKRYWAQALLGAALNGEKRFSEAEPLLVSGYSGMAERKSTMAAREQGILTQTAQWLAQLYKDSGRPEKAAEWQAKLPAPKK